MCYPSKIDVFWRDFGFKFTSVSHQKWIFSMNPQQKKLKLCESSYLNHIETSLKADFLHNFGVVILL